MNDVKSICFTLCIGVVICSIMTLLIPKIKENKMLKNVLSIFLLVSVLGSVAAIPKSVSFDVNSITPDINTSIERNIVEYIEKTVYDNIKKAIKKEGINEKYSLNVDVSYENDSVILNYANISFEPPHKINIDELKNKIKNELGIIVDIK